MEREERQHLRGISDEVGAWSKRATRLLKVRQSIERAAQDATERLTGRVRPAAGTTTAWRVLQLAQSDRKLVTAIARSASLPPLTGPTQQGIEVLTGDAQRALTDVKPLFGPRRVFSRTSRKDRAGQAASYLVDLRDWLIGTELDVQLDDLEAWDNSVPPTVEVSSILDDSVGSLTTSARTPQS